MEESLKIRPQRRIAVFVTGSRQFLTALQYVREGGVAACGVDADGIKKSGLADAVLSCNQRDATEPWNRKIGDSTKSRDR